MGINTSKRKKVRESLMHNAEHQITLRKYRAHDTYQRRWWNYETHNGNIETGEMNTPVYQQQGDPDKYMNFCESDNIDTDSVWQPRRKNEDLYTLDDEDLYLSSEGILTDVRGELNEETSEVVIRETVLDGPDAMGDTRYEKPKFKDASMTEDLYSIISASSETNMKQLVDINAQQTTEAKKYLELGTPARPQRRLHRYEEMVIIFQPLIVQNVIARHLIPHLTFLEDAAKVNFIADRSPRSAVVYIIDELKNNHKDPGRWKQFIEALERCGYKYIAGILRGEKPVDHSYQREYLKIIAPYLRTNISPIELAEVLWSADVLSDEDKEEIQHFHNNFGPLVATDRLLDRVPRKHRYWYSHLIEGLRKTKMEHAAEMLDIPELRDTSAPEVYYTDDYVKPLTTDKQTTQSIESADTRQQQSKIQLKDAQRRDAVATANDDVIEALPDSDFYDDCDVKHIPIVSTRRPSTADISEMREGDKERQISPRPVHESTNKDGVANGTEYEDYEEPILYDEYVQYGLPPRPSVSHISSRAHKAEQIVTPENTHRNALTNILTQQDSKTYIQLQPTDSSLPPDYRCNNKTIEAERETILPPQIPKRLNRQRNGPTIHHALPQPTFKSSKHNEDCTVNLTANAAEFSWPQPLSKRQTPNRSCQSVPERQFPLRSSSSSEDIEEDNEDFEIVVLQYPPKKIDVSPPFPSPFSSFSKGSKRSKQLPSKPFCKPPVPLPRIKTMSTDTHERPGKKELEESYNDDGYTEVDNKPSPVIHDNEFEDVTIEGEEIESDKKRNIKRNVEKCAVADVDEIANGRASGNKMGISKSSSQKKKKKSKKLAQSRKRKRGNIFRKMFQLKNLDKTSNADEEIISSEKANGAVQLNMNRQGRSKRSRRWPIQLREAIDSKEYYSQPFRDEIRKIDRTHPVPPLDICKPDNRDTNLRKKLADPFHRLDRNKELREIFNTCRKRHGIDQEGIKSDMNIQELSQDEIHPDVEALLKDVQQQKEELTVLVQQEPVMKAKVEIQTDINEKLKQKRLLQTQFDVKAKVASALKEGASNPCYQSDLETNNPDFIQHYDEQISSARAMNIEELEKPDGILTTITEEADVIINKTDQDVIYKDSAFYSDSVRL